MTPINAVHLPFSNTLLTTLKETNAMIAGGWVLTKLHKMNDLGIHSIANDIDIFFETKKDYEKVLEEFYKTHTLGYENENAIVLVPKSSDTFEPRINTNLVKIFQKHKDTLKRFDFKNSQCFSLYPFNEIKRPSGPVLTHLYFNLEEIKRDGITLKWLNRVRKYQKEKQLKVPDETSKIIFEYLKEWQMFKDKDYQGHGYEQDKENINQRRKDYLEYIFVEILEIPKVQELILAEHHSGRLLLPIKMASPSSPIYLQRFNQYKSLLYQDFMKSGLEKDLPEDYKEAYYWMHDQYPEIFL